MAGSADFYADGQWNFFCDLCGRKNKSSDGVKTWDNHYVCRHHKEVRNPQDFVRGVKDDPSVPWVRAEAPDDFVPLPWTRTFNDSITLDEEISKLIRKIIGSYKGLPVNDGVLNGAAINANATDLLSDPERYVLTETVQVVIQHYIVPQSINGAALNTYPLG